MFPSNKSQLHTGNLTYLPVPFQLRFTVKIDSNLHLNLKEKLLPSDPWDQFKTLQTLDMAEAVQ